MQKSPFVDFRMRKSTKDRIKPYGYYFIQQISGLLSVNRQPKSGRDSVKDVNEGESTHPSQLQAKYKQVTPP